MTVKAGAATKNTISCGIAWLITPRPE